MVSGYDPLLGHGSFSQGALLDLFHMGRGANKGFRVCHVQVPCTLLMSGARPGRELNGVCDPMHSFKERCSACVIWGVFVTCKCHALFLMSERCSTCFIRGEGPRGEGRANAGFRICHVQVPCTLLMIGARPGRWEGVEWCL